VENKLAIAVTFIVGVALGYASLLSGVWYLMILSGAIVGVILSTRWLYQFLALFAAGAAANITYIYPLLGDGLPKLMYDVGLIAGLNGNILLPLMVVLSAAMSGAGGLVGSSIREAARTRLRREQTQKAQ